LLRVKWLYALGFGFIACAHYPEPPPDVDALGVETCVGSCARRARTGCLEPALQPTCVATCERIRAAGLYAPERCIR